MRKMTGEVYMSTGDASVLQWNREFFFLHVELNSRFILFFVLETIRTGAMRVKSHPCEDRRDAETAH